MMNISHVLFFCYGVTDRKEQAVGKDCIWNIMKKLRPEC